MFYVANRKDRNVFICLYNAKLIASSIFRISLFFPESLKRTENRLMRDR